MSTGSFSSRLHSLHPSHEVTNNEYSFHFNLMIKTIGLHRYLVKYIYSTRLWIFSFFNNPFFEPSRLLLPSRSHSPGCAVVPMLHLYKTGQNSSARHHLVDSKPYSLFFSEVACQTERTTKNRNDEMCRG